MTAYNSIATMKRLKAAGMTPRQAETLADEIQSAIKASVTREDLRTELDLMAARLTIRLGGIVTAVVGLAVAFLTLK